MNDNITKLNMVIESLENNIEERNFFNQLDKKTIADAKKKIKALEKLEAKERQILGDLFSEPVREEVNEMSYSDACGYRPTVLPDYE